MNIQDLKKRRLIDEWLGNDHVLLHLDSRVSAVKVPDNLLGNPLLTLKVSRLFHGRIDLEESGISVSLKFSGEYFECFIPWNSIWAVSSDKGERKVWEDVLPEHMAQDIIDRSVSPRPDAKSAGFLKRIK